MDNIKQSKEISSKEFQRKLFDWFEKRGLLSELRAFMRHRMIAALYSSESPCPASHFSTETAVSPSLQALLLLVAEFLVQQKYHYTMSVMVAEAPLLASFPKFSGYVSYMSQTETIHKGSNFPRYSERDVQEILEVLGIPSNSESMEHILRLYSNNDARESLLACMLTALSAIIQNFSNETHKKNKTSKPSLKNINDIDNCTQWTEEIRLILLRAQVTSGQLLQVEDLIRKLHSDTANRTRREERERNNKINHVREQELLAAALVREENFRSQTQEVEEDLRSKQKHLEQVSLQLRQQHDEVLNRLTRVQKHADEIKKQENDLVEREKALEKKQAMVENEHSTLSALRAELQEAAHSLRQEHANSKTIFELSRLQDRCLHLETELKETKNQLLSSSVTRIERGIQATEILWQDSSIPQKVMGGATHHEEQNSSGSSVCSSVEKPQEKMEKKSQVTLLKRVLQRLQQENSELKAIAAQQRRRIDELTSRATQLANYVAEQSDMPSLFREERPISDRVLQPPPLPPHFMSQTQRMSGGDVPDSSTQPSSVPLAYSPQAHEKDLFRRSKRSMQLRQSSSLSSDESPTEEVMREARNRLKKLEEESEAVDRRYRDFRLRQVDCLSSSASIGNAPKEQNLKNLPMGQSTSDTLTSSMAQGTFPIQQSQFSSPAHNGSSRISARRALSSTLSPNFSVLQRSQIPLPQRSIFSFSPTAILPVSSTPSSSVPYYSSVLRSPADKFRNLIGSHSSFMRSSSSFANTRGGAISATNFNVPPALPTRERKVNLDNLESAQEKGKAFVNHTPDGMVPQDLIDLPKQLDSPKRNSVVQEEANILGSQSNLCDVSTLNPSSTNNQLVTSSATDVVDKPQTSDMNVGQLSVKSVSPTLKSPEPMSLLGPKSALQVPLVPLPQTEQSSSGVTQTPTVQPLLSPPGENGKLIEHQSTSVQLSNQLLQPSGESSIHPEPRFFQTALKEASTVSSLPGVSQGGNIEMQMTSDIGVSLNEANKDILKPTTLFVEDMTQIQETSSSVPIQGQGIRTDTTNAERKSELLNTSLSSIENSDKRVSVGSVGKATDEDDDDFW